MKIPPLTAAEMATFDTIRAKAPIDGDLSLTRFMLDGQPVAIIGTAVHNRFTGKYEGWMPLALVLDDTTIARLRDINGSAGVVASPFDLQ